MNTLKSDCSKGEELTRLHDYKELSGTGTYLSMLFTDKFITWCEEQVKNDFSLDIFDYYQASIKELNESESARIKAETHIQVLENQLENQGKIANSQAQTISELNRRLAETESRAIGYCVSNSSKDDIILERDEEIIRLKARIYDLICA